MANSELLQEVPRWQREIANFRGIKSLFVLEKNVADLYPCWDPALDDPDPEYDVEFLGLRAVLQRLFCEQAGTNAYQLVFYDPIDRFSDPFHDGVTANLVRAAGDKAARMRLEVDRLNSFSGDASQQGGAGTDVLDAQVIRALLTPALEPTGASGEAGSGGPLSDRPIAVVVDMASRMLSSTIGLRDGEVEVFSNLLLAARDADKVGQCVNTLVLICNNLRDLPEWFVAHNPDLQSVVVPMPDRNTRQLFVRSFQCDFNFSEGPTRLGEPGCAERFIDKSDGMSLRELDELRRMYVRGHHTEQEASSLIDIFKYGIRENKWVTFLEKLGNDPEAALRGRVMGQDRAIEAVVSVIKRSAMGLSGATHSSSSKPKGILFLAGPTGTGKTELVKAVTELLFGDERNMLRFDMSEYRQDNSDQKLFGAPPGYVGYAEGGQLTNAVRANPFSVLLFDEVEKASATIMDKFLQILEDGRMTDGQGNTVYFSETIIFFTSNIGFSREVYDAQGNVVDRVQLIDPGTPYDEMLAQVRAAMETRFKPEFMGRIGDNVVLFDYIDGAPAQAILSKQVRQVNTRVESLHGVRVEVGQDCWDLLFARALEPGYREKGGRGIGNLVEDVYLNALSDFLFDLRGRDGARVVAHAAGSGVRFEVVGA